MFQNQSITTVSVLLLEAPVKQISAHSYAVCEHIYALIQNNHHPTAGIERSSDPEALLLCHTHLLILL